jgi:hypothetical protein
MMKAQMRAPRMPSVPRVVSLPMESVARVVMTMSGLETQWTRVPWLRSEYLQALPSPLD